MKKIFVFAMIVFLFPFVGISQPIIISGALGVELGSPYSVVKQKGEAAKWSIDPEYSNKNQLVYDDVSFGKYMASVLRLSFSQERLAVICAYFDAPPPQLMNKFVELEKVLAEKYGVENAKTLREFTPPYEQGDGYEATAIKAGYARVYTVWYERSPDNPKDKDQNFILLEIDSETMSIKLQYIHGRMLNDELERQEKESDKSF